MTSPDPADAVSAGPFADPNIQKVELEIQDLRNKLKWDSRIGPISSILASLILVAGFFVGIVQYKDSQRQEFKRRFWEKQLETYSALASSAAHLASNLPNDSVRSAEFDRFSQLYNGDFALIADDTAVIAAREYLQRYTEFREDRRRQDRTKRQARAMANAFRYALAKNGDFAIIPMRRGE